MFRLDNIKNRTIVINVLGIYGSKYEQHFSCTDFDSKNNCFVSKLKNMASGKSKIGIPNHFHVFYLSKKFGDEWVTLG